LPPPQIEARKTRKSLSFIDGERCNVAVNDKLTAHQIPSRTAMDAETGKVITRQSHCRIDTPVEVDYYRNGGILQTMLRNRLKTKVKKTANK
jgi:aconitate hydratase